MDINKVISIVRILKEQPTNSVGDGSATSLPPSVEPGVKKKKKNIFLGKGSRKFWLQNLKDNGKS